MHVITGLRRGGAEGVLVRLILATHKYLNHVVVVLSEPGHFGPALHAAGVPVYALNLRPRLAVVSGVPKLLSIMRREQPQVIQTWLYHADLLGGIASRVLGLRSVAWGIRNNNLDIQSIGCTTRLVALTCALLSRVIPQAIVCNSEAARRAHIRFGYRERIFRVIPNGFDTDELRPNSRLRDSLRSSLGVSNHQFLIGMVARWDRQKDHATLLGAMRTVMTHHPSSRLLLAGTGMDARNASLVSMLDEAEIAKNTLLLGPRDDVPAIMNGLDLHVLSSLGEAFPNVVGEAMACGTPCVVTDVGDSAAIVGDAGWVVPPRNATALATAIETAMASLAGRDGAAFRHECRERIVQQFGLDKMIAAYRGVWRELYALNQQRSR